ncbi:MAG: hypothetical protein KC422_11320 [Trueperaceae bacterium]|nr:hypothetical protein [Trueperaceae bacterium]
MFKKILSLLALVVLFAACSTTPEPTPDPGDNPEPGSGSLPQELQGEWFAGSISSIQFYDPITGDWAAPNGSGFYMIFKADGSYEEGAVINSTQYNCSLQLLGVAKGTAEVNGTKLTLHQTQRKVHVSNTCGNASDSSEGIKDYVYGIEFKDDAFGTPALFLTETDGSPHGTFYPWGNADPNPEPSSLSLSGTVLAPAGGDVAGTTIYACYVQGEGCHKAKSKTLEISSHGSSASFAFEGLENAPYFLLAFGDANSNGELFDDDDTYGEVSTELAPPQAGLELQLYYLKDFDQPEPEPELSISGTVTAPADGDVQGVTVFACVIVGDACDEARSQVFTISSRGPSAMFEFVGLESTPYYLFAAADANGSGELDAGDYFVEYGEVTPPANELTLELQVIQ